MGANGSVCQNDSILRSFFTWVNDDQHWVMQDWASNMVLIIFTLSSDIFWFLFVVFFFFTESQIQGFIKFLFKLGRISKTYLGIYFGFMSAKLSNNFHMRGQIKDLKLVYFHLSFSHNVVNRVSLWGFMCLEALTSFRSLGSPEKSSTLFQDLLFSLILPFWHKQHLS